MAHRPPRAELGLNTGEKTRLHRILHEHGPRDFFANPAAGDPKYILKLALEGGFNGIAIQIGPAEKFYWDYAGELPLVLKLNGKTEIPSDAEALSPLHGSVEDAVRLGADAHRLGMPLIVWAYPR